jgi:hypothetical protein
MYNDGDNVCMGIQNHLLYLMHRARSVTDSCLHGGCLDNHRAVVSESTRVAATAKCHLDEDITPDFYFRVPARQVPGRCETSADSLVGSQSGRVAAFLRPDTHRHRTLPA